MFISSTNFNYIKEKVSVARLHSETASIVKQSLEIFSLSDDCSSHLSLNEHLMWAPNILFNCSLLKIWHWHIIKFLTEFKLQHNEGFFFLEMQSYVFSFALLLPVKCRFYKSYAPFKNDLDEALWILCKWSSSLLSLKTDHLFQAFMCCFKKIYSLKLVQLLKCYSRWITAKK